MNLQNIQNNNKTISYNTNIFNRKFPTNEASSPSGSNCSRYPILKNVKEPKTTYFQKTFKTEKPSTNVNIKPDKDIEKNLTENKFKQKKNDEGECKIFTGTAERVIKWNKIYKNFCYYEVISSVISLQESSIKLQKIMLLKDKKGPILQVHHYVNDHIKIEDFHVGQMLRCVGRMVGPNTLHAVSIREAAAAEVENLPRLCYICDHAVAKAM